MIKDNIVKYSEEVSIIYFYSNGKMILNNKSIYTKSKEEAFTIFYNLLNTAYDNKDNDIKLNISII